MSLFMRVLGAWLCSLCMVGDALAQSPWLQQRDQLSLRKGELVRLADVVVTDTNYAAARGPLPNEVLQDKVVSREELEAFIGRAGLSVAGVKGATLTRVQILVPVTKQSLEEAALNDLPLSASLRDSIADRTTSGTLWLPDGARFERDLTRFDPVAGRALVTTRVVTANEVWKTIQHRFAWSAVPEVVARRDIRAGAVIQPEDLSATMAELSGRVAVVPISEGSAVNASNTREQFAVEQDSTVTVSVKRGAVELALQARALSAGRLGQRVHLFSDALKTEFHAVVSAVGEAYVPN